MNQKANTDRSISFRSHPKFSVNVCFSIGRKGLDIEDNRWLWYGDYIHNTFIAKNIVPKPLRDNIISFHTGSSYYHFKPSWIPILLTEYKVDSMGSQQGLAYHSEAVLRPLPLYLIWAGIPPKRIGSKKQVQTPGIKPNLTVSDPIDCPRHTTVIRGAEHKWTVWPR